MEFTELISVIVITYNSSKYIIDTLESIKKQNYKNIQLIISDDSSTDETLRLAKHWLEENGNRFIDFKIIETPINTGITPNVNRGILQATGKYIKLIAGDDLLISTCLENMYNYCEQNNLDVAYSRVELFTDPYNPKIEKRLRIYDDLMYEIFYKTTKQQYKILLTGFPLHTVGLFFKRDFIFKVGLFDEKYRMMDDYPFAVKITSQNFRLNLYNNCEVKYRVRTTSNTSEFKKSKRKTYHNSDLYCFENDELIPRMLRERMYISIYDLYIRRLSEAIRNSGDNMFIKLIGALISYLSFSKIALRCKMIMLWIKNKKNNSILNMEASKYGSST